MTIQIHVIAAQYLSEYKILVKFSDSTEQVVDFEGFLMTNPHPQHDQYRDKESFKDFKIEKGTLVWGEHWDLMFPIEQLHAGYIEN